MRFFLVLCTLLQTSLLFAQHMTPPFTVRYLSGYLEAKDSLQIKQFLQKHRFHPMPHYEITVMDTAAYIRPYSKEKERKEDPLGSHFRSHNMLIDFKVQKEFRQSEPYNAGRYIVEASYRPLQFDLLKDSMVILGYTCYKAVPVDQLQNNSYTYWYAPALKYGISVFGFNGLPGLVLAVEIKNDRQRYAVIAERIEPETRKFIKPQKGTPIGALAFEYLLSDLRSKYRY
jgi:GLPGLI family protein